MSLLLNGAKTMTIAGTEMQCLEIYTGEAYTLPIQFLDSGGNAANANGWTLATVAKFYNTTDVTYSTPDSVVLGNLTLLSPQPSTGAGTYSANLDADWINDSIGSAYLYIPADLTGNTGSPNATPTISLANSAANSTLVIITLTVTRFNSQSGANDINKEPLGFIVRYQ